MIPLTDCIAVLHFRTVFPSQQIATLKPRFDGHRTISVSAQSIYPTQSGR